MAWIFHRNGHPVRKTAAVLYFGAMELLQAVQYIFVAVPDDNYAMCKSPTNQFLTVLGFVHIWFQPFFYHLAAPSSWRKVNLKTRHENDIVLRLCLAGGLWGIARYLLVAFWPDNPAAAARPSESCPNYEWIRDGYDAGIGWITPNLPGHSCTFISNTSTGHLAWATPMYQVTYYVPSTSLHLFLMIAPRLVLKGDFLKGIAVLVTGPVMAGYLTKSLNEQASIWCFFSMFLCLSLIVVSFIEERVTADGPAKTVTHAGGFGEKPMEYHLATSHGNGTTTLKANGKKVN